MMAHRTPTWRRTATDDLDPKAKDWIQQASDEYVRRHGRFRDLVLRMLAPWQPEANGVWQTRVVRRRRRTTEPSRADLMTAHHESTDPLPAPIVDYIMKHYVEGLPRKTGPKAPSRSTWEKVMIEAFYRHQLCKANQRKAHGLTSRPATRAKERTAKKFGISVSTLNGYIAPRRLLKTSPK